MYSNRWKSQLMTVADSGFPVWGVDPLKGGRPPTWAPFGENERIGSCRGAGPALGMPPTSANG